MFLQKHIFTETMRHIQSHIHIQRLYPPLYILFMLEFGVKHVESYILLVLPTLVTFFKACNKISGSDYAALTAEMKTMCCFTLSDTVKVKERNSNPT